MQPLRRLKLVLPHRRAAPPRRSQPPAVAPLRMQAAPRRLHYKLSRAAFLSQVEPHAQDHCTKPSRAGPCSFSSRATKPSLAPSIQNLRGISSVGAQALQPLFRLGPRCLESTLVSRLGLAKMPPRRGARRGGGRGGRGAGRGQPEEQPAVSAVDPNAPITQADLAAMEQRYQDMLQAALTPFLAAQQNQAAPVQA
ncbi:uncharacterized protein E6C27_scaffold21G005470 [Cucumis melo var. makuwa]|uniref:Gag protease polyprotein n=1 Tax=Cucumis melo var. makuwa TaxID=1194695 RepID=A0A5A7VMB1_CUCMM|nr:uncharacterized protein E6C27_scaffold21G005470 [Cucumis melo var. makuwa]